MFVLYLLAYAYAFAYERLCASVRLRACVLVQVSVRLVHVRL